jgi:hypothetical protein
VTAETTEVARASPTDIIASRRWDRALFTTYSLSLTFFESVVFRALRESGCHDVSVVVDADGYASSLMERRASRVGHEYQLVAVGLPDGVFHPKCTYLHGPEGDLLLVGSGNVTFGGWGRNIEVLEVLDSAQSPSAFAAFAEFLDAVRQRTDILMGTHEWTTVYAELARVAARGAPSEGNPGLVHSVVSPIADQLVAFASAHGGARTLTVLSPFHDRDARTVRELAARLGDVAVVIGLPPNENAGTTFPFASAKLPRPARAVRPVTDDANRPLHAKWIEIECGERNLTVTGSVNATHNALGSCNNVEVGVIREGTERVHWVDAPVPTQTAEQPRRRAGLGQRFIIQASISGGASLGGRLLGLSDPAGSWSGMLTRPDGTAIAIALDVTADGRFHARVPLEIIHASGLQIEVTSGNRRAAGWVQNDDLLRMGRQARVPIGPLVRRLHGEATEDDDVALLDFFAMSSEQHAPIFRVSRREAATSGSEIRQPKNDTPDTFVPVAELLAGSDTQLEPRGGAGADRAEDAVARVLAAVRHALLAPPGSDEEGERASNPELGDVPVDDDDEHGHGRNAASPAPRSSSRVESALDRFDAAMKIAVDTASDASALRGLLVVWLEVSLHMHIYRHARLDAALLFMSGWLRRVTSIAHASDPPDALDEHVVTCAVLAVEAAADRTGEHLAEAHAILERWFEGTVSGERARPLLIVERAMGFARELVGTRAEAMPSTLGAILAAPTRRQALVDAITSGNARSAVFEGPAGRDLLRAVRAGGRNIREQAGDGKACPHCWVTLTEMARASLANSRFANCGSCGRFVVRTRP